ncbi:hypothetical protein QC762_701350 [Podospora pseudocomata]|uniref:Uncharacterized protein n=1 Tax=Podospora pseudocomata TaxID=2093779 RepID=A0ABR0G5F6_9PEZI|nr:hypothetical protein QC762_701350 [Podospora pseudocomata]
MIEAVSIKVIISDPSLVISATDINFKMHPHLPRSPPRPHRRTEPPPKLASCVPGASHQPCIVLSEQHEVDIQVPWRSVLRSISLGIRIH